jgi:hypothetical protein
MTQKTFNLSLLALLLLAGCQPATSSNAPEASNSSEAPKADEPKVESNKSLQGDAYEYYGLGRTSPMKISIKQGDMPERKGEQTVKLSKSESDFEEYIIENKGDLSSMGTIVLRLEKGGIKVSETAQMTPDPNSWELPNELTVGKTWQTNTKPGSIMELKSTNKVQGTEEVKTPVATYKDALVISSTGTGSSAGKSFALNSKIWFVKGRGAVRTEVTQVVDKTETKTVMQEIP